MSFNFGPTLLSWLEEKEPEVYRAIVAADAESARRFSGHGIGARAAVQPHDPAARERARPPHAGGLGRARFRHRFGREPEGMWLPETAVDTASLEALAEAGIVFTILAPHQATHVRKLGETEWQEAPRAASTPRCPTACRCPRGASIAVFFYDGPVSRAVAFDNLLSTGERFAERLAGAFTDDRGAAAARAHRHRRRDRTGTTTGTATWRSRTRSIRSPPRTWPG